MEGGVTVQHREDAKSEKTQKTNTLSLSPINLSGRSQKNTKLVVLLARNEQSRLPFGPPPSHSHDVFPVVVVVVIERQINGGRVRV